MFRSLIPSHQTRLRSVAFAPRVSKMARSALSSSTKQRNPIVPVALSEFAKNLNVETAFAVLAVAKQLKAAGKDVVELEIGDSPFESTASAKKAGEQAIRDNQSHYCPSPGLPAFREEAARFVRDEFAIPARAENVVVGPGAKIFEQFFCEAFLNPGDG